MSSRRARLRRLIPPLASEGVAMGESIEKRRRCGVLAPGLACLAGLALLACHNEPGPAAPPSGTSGSAAPQGAGAAAPPPGPTTVSDKDCPSDFTIDDAEDNNNQLLSQKGRNGYWYTFVDKVGSTI